MVSLVTVYRYIYIYIGKGASWAQVPELMHGMSGVYKLTHACTVKLLKEWPPTNIGLSCDPCCSSAFQPLGQTNVIQW